MFTLIDYLFSESSASFLPKSSLYELMFTDLVASLIIGPVCLIVAILLQEMELEFLPSCMVIPITMFCIIVLGCCLFDAPFTYLGMSALKNNDRSYLVPSMIVKPIVFTVLVGIVIYQARTNACFEVFMSPTLKFVGIVFVTVGGVLELLYIIMMVEVWRAMKPRGRTMSTVAIIWFVLFVFVIIVFIFDYLHLHVRYLEYILFIVSKGMLLKICLQRTSGIIAHSHVPGYLQGVPKKMSQ